MTEDGLAGQVVLGHGRGAAEATTTSSADSPGLTWLLDGFTLALGAAGHDATARNRLFVDNPARLYAFAEAAA